MGFYWSNMLLLKSSVLIHLVMAKLEQNVDYVASNQW